MSTAELNRELGVIGRQLGRWQAQLQAAIWGAIVLGVLWLVCMSDLLIQFNRAGRVIGWVLIVTVVVVGIWRVSAAVRARRSSEAVAARIEQKFPQLDNHLINFVQFAHQSQGARIPPAADPQAAEQTAPRQNGHGELQDEYLRRGLPQWQGLDFRQLKDTRRHRRAMIAFAVGLLVVAAPFLWTARGWSNSLARVLNPFSDRSASTLARLLGITPENSTVTAGNPITFTCKAEGQRGQEVWIDLWPSDDDKSSIRVGELSGDAQSFSYALSRVTAPLAYRFRAGDARSDQYEIAVQPPLALTKLAVSIQPPDYTKVAPREFNALTDSVAALRGSEMRVTMEFNRELTEGIVTVGGVTARRDTDAQPWTAVVTEVESPEVMIAATDASGDKFESVLRVDLAADRPPVIRVLAPTERVTLAPGSSALIRFEVSDDYGVEGVRLETEKGESMKEWTRDTASKETFGQSDVRGRETDAQRNGETDAKQEGVLAAEWTGEPGRYRLVASDSRQESRSPLIVFDLARANELVTAQGKAASQTVETLSKLVVMQRENLERTSQLHARNTEPNDASAITAWKNVAASQREIRAMAGRLVADPRKPLGALGGVVAALHGGAMLEVVDVLELVVGADAAKKQDLGLKAIGLETTILRVLTAAKGNYQKVEQHRRISDLLAMIDALVSGQEAALKETKGISGGPSPVGAAAPPAFAAGTASGVSSNSASRERGEAKAPSELVARQDRLAGDTSDFAAACRTESGRLKNTDADFAALILKIAEECTQREVSANMLRAAELLESTKAVEALPLQERALAALKDFQKQLNEWRVSEAREKMDDVKRVVAEASKKFDKLVDLQSKVVESMRAVEAQKDLSDAEKEEFMEELEEFQANIKDAALKIADDLHIFPELPVGNELVQDIYQVFEEVTQTPGSESAPATELGLQKEDFMLEMMEEIKERFDDMEMWLTAAPDATKRLTENFDKTEMPEMAVIPLPEELEDIIGELMEQEEEIRDKSDDSATNQAVPDMPMGWDIAEGEWSTFSAKGKSGNERPEHKDQDGRSLVGREGMSDGETTAGSGKINEGDEKIEARRTRDSAQAGQVAEETHTDAKATGGGKLSGWDDETGMAGEGPRRDANLPPSLIGMQAMLRRNAEAIYARATMLHIRTGSLDEAVQAVKNAEEAMRSGKSIERVREFQRRASVALEKAQTDLAGGYYAEALPASATGPEVDEQLTGVPDEAPSDYRDLVAEYFKSLSGGE